MDCVMMFVRKCLNDLFTLTVQSGFTYHRAFFAVITQAFVKNLVLGWRGFRAFRFNA